MPWQCCGNRRPWQSLSISEYLPSNQLSNCQGLCLADHRTKGEIWQIEIIVEMGPTSAAAGAGNKCHTQTRNASPCGASKPMAHILAYQRL